VAGSCEHGNELLGFIKGGIYLGKLSDHQFPKKDSAPWSYLVSLVTVMAESSAECIIVRVWLTCNQMMCYKFLIPLHIGIPLLTVCSDETTFD